MKNCTGSLIFLKACSAGYAFFDTVPVAESVEYPSYGTDVNIEISHYCVVCTLWSMPLPNDMPTQIVQVSAGSAQFTGCHGFSIS